MHMTHKELVDQVSENLFMQSGKIKAKQVQLLVHVVSVSLFLGSLSLD